MAVVASVTVVQVNQPQHGQECTLKAAWLHKSFKAKYVVTWVQFLLLSKLRITSSGHVHKSGLRVILSCFWGLN